MTASHVDESPCRLFREMFIAALRCGTRALRDQRAFDGICHAYHAVVYRQNGNPQDVLSYEELPRKEEIGKDEIRLKILAVIQQHRSSLP